MSSSLPQHQKCTAEVGGDYLVKKLQVSCNCHIGLRSSGLSPSGLDFGYDFFGFGGVASIICYYGEPIAANLLATARPMPRDDPVTITLFLADRPVISKSL
jgi:hypothetical protein